jgi:hypothetical protein
MAAKRNIRRKIDLERLSAWPHPEQSRTGKRLSRPRSGRPTPYKAIAHDLPALYHETYIRVIPRDPHLLFSFWEIAQSHAGAPRLRLYEMDSGDTGTIIGDYVIEKGTRSRYIRVPHPGRRYRLVFGTGAPDLFVPQCSSNEVTAPAAHLHEPQCLTKVNMGKRTAEESLVGFSAYALPFAASYMTDLSSAL